jgi:hypothetical protein
MESNVQKRIISVFGAAETGKTALSEQITAKMPGAVRYGTYEQMTREEARQLPHTELMRRTYEGIGQLAIATGAEIIVVDEDPVDTTLIDAFRREMSIEEIDSLKEKMSSLAADVLPGEGRPIRGRVHMTMRSSEFLDRLAASTHALHAAGGTIEPLGLASSDVHPLVAADQYSRFLETQGDCLVRIDRGSPYDLDAITLHLQDPFANP